MINLNVIINLFNLKYLKKALHIRALRSFTDEFNKKRLNGEEWLVTSDDTETYIPTVNEEVSNNYSIA